MGLFSCKVCLEKDKRIEDLKAQITAQHILITKLTVVPQYGTALSREVNYALDGAGHTVPLTEEQKAEQQSVQDEAIRLLTGQY